MDITQRVGSRFLRVSTPLDWPAGRRRTPTEKRPRRGSPKWGYAISQLDRWLFLINAGYAELSVGEGSDPGAAMRLYWRGRRLAIAADCNDNVTSNVVALRAPLECLFTLGLDDQYDVLEAFVDSISVEEAGEVAPLALKVDGVVGATETELGAVGEALAEAGARIAIGESFGSTELFLPPATAYWSNDDGIVEVRVETHPRFQQVLRLARSALELETWLQSADFRETLRGTRWILRLERGSLSTAEARAWIVSRARIEALSSEVKAWLRGGKA
ncbi:MAG TPA: hypothetical protein VGE01_00475 [Fimbriimonas sp.]